MVSALCSICPPPVALAGPQGAKIGVLGANGAGKSSLMRILAGVDNSFDGRVVRAPGIRWVTDVQRWRCRQSLVFSNMWDA